MGGQTVLSEAEGAELCTSETSLYSSLSLKAHQRPGGMDKLLRRCLIRTPIIRECLAECLGVYVLILFGCGSVAQVTTSQEKNGQYLSINLGFALGVTFGVFVSRGVSGLRGLLEDEEHHEDQGAQQTGKRNEGEILDSGGAAGDINRRTRSCNCSERHPWVKLPLYTIFQVLGAFLAAATVGLQYYDAIQKYSGGQLTVTGPTATAGIFCTFPAEYLSLWGGIMDQ
ncbi:hypothetical protein AMECASPLE_028873, partial [Ameca splendens]